MLKKFACLLLSLTVCGALQAAEQPQVILHTSMGPLTLELNPQKAPITVKNFMTYVDQGFYDGLIFHRIIPGFMVQGGGFTSTMERSTPRAAIPLEASNGLKNNRGTIAMARTNSPDSATSQFFINLVDNDFLNATRSKPGYTVFGRVIDGLELVDEMAATPTGNQGPFRDVPLQPIVIKSVERLTP